MREVKFKTFPGTGAGTPSWEYVPLAQFLLDSPLFSYELRAFGVMPPLHILNEKLSEGNHDAGMGSACEWKPFEVDLNEYQSLLGELLTNPEFDIAEDDELKEKPNYKKWRGALLSKYAKKIRDSR